MKISKIVALSLLIGNFSFAQTLEDAIQKTENERYDVATEEFKKLIAKEPSNAKNYFYFGENYLAKENIDSALIVWEKGNTVDPEEDLILVAKGKSLWLKGKTTEASVIFAEALKSTKRKNGTILREIAKTYIFSEKTEYDLAIELLTQAIKVDAKNAENFLLMGDVLLKKTPADASPAIENYNKALALNPKSPKGIVRTAKVYQAARNYELADSKYKAAQALDPTYAPAYRENAELYMMFNQSTKAIANWEKYLTLNNSIDARYRFATSLFQGKRYCEAITELNKVLDQGFNNLYIQRMMYYSLYECETEMPEEQYTKALEVSNGFFKMAPEDKVISIDYQYVGKIQIKLGNDSLAIISLMKAYEMDPVNNGDNLTEISKIYVKAKNYDKVIETFILKQDGNVDNLTSQEYYQLGKAYYFGPKDYEMADSSFTLLTLKAPSFGPAYIWQARSLYKLDTLGNYLPKNSYASFLDVLTEEQKVSKSYKSMILEANRYLGDYYFSSEEKDVAKATEYWTAVQALEPEDKQAEAFFKSQK